MAWLPPSGGRMPPALRLRRSEHEPDRSLNRVGERPIVRRRQVGLHVALVAPVEGVVDLDAGREVMLPELPGPGEREIQGRNRREPAGAVARADEILELVHRR